MMQAVIPTMKRQRGSKIVNISSVGGRIAFPPNSIYDGTKFASEGLSESIQSGLDLSYIDFIHSGKASSDNDKEEYKKALISKATGLTGKTAEHGNWLRISDEREVLR